MTFTRTLREVLVPITTTAILVGAQGAAAQMVAHPRGPAALTAEKAFAKTR